MRQLRRSVVHDSVATVLALVSLIWAAPVLRAIGASLRDSGPPPVSAPPARALAALSATPSVSPGSPALTGASRAQALEALAAMPLHFEVNAGQVDADVRFLARGAGYGVTLTSRGAVLSLTARRGPGSTEFDAAVLGLALVGAAPNPRLAGIDPLTGRANYYRGNDPSKWQTDVATFARVRYEQVYPGIDLVYYGNQGELQYDFHVAPGADPSMIRFGVEGADTVALDPEGNLQIGVAGRTVRQRRPLTYQDADGARREVPSRFVLDGQTVRFEIGAYDARRELVIDPSLTYSTWFGGASEEGILDVQIDGDGNIVIAGHSQAAQGFPATPGAKALRTPAGGSPPSDAFVAKFNPAGSALIFSTLLGGDGSENNLPQSLNGGLGVDAAGNIHVTGLTSSLNFPTTAGAHDTTFNGGASVVTDGYYTKLSPTGGLLYSTYFGGTDEEISSGLAVDAANNVYIVGQTTSNTAEGFSTPNGLRTLFGSIRDGFLLKFNSSGVLTYGTYIGGPNGQNVAYDVAVAATNQVVVVGSATGGAGFPTTPGAFQPGFGGGSGDGDAFLLRIDTSITGAGGLLYGTYYGGTSNESFYGVTVDASGRIYACGYTQSPGLVTAMAAGGAVPSGTRRDALVAKFDTSLSGAPSKVYAIRVAAVDASLGDEHANDVAVDALGRAWVVGLHNGSTLNLINPFDSQAANLRAFVAQIAADGASALLVSYAGGRNTNNTNLLGVALNTAGEAYMAGFTVEPSLNSASLLLVNPFQAVYGGGGSDGTLQKLGFSIDLSLTKTASAGVVLPGQPVTFTLTVTNPSGDPASGVVVTDSLPVGLQFVSCSATLSGVCGGTGNARTVTFATLTPGATASIQIVATMVAVTPGQQILNRAEVVAGVLDPVPANNVGTAIVSVPTLEPTGDADGDGLSNGFESTYGLDPFGGAGGGPNDDPDGDGKTNLQEQQEGTHPRGFVITYLAEGATGTFFDTRLAIANPTASVALVLTRFQRADGVTIRDYRVVGPMSRATIDVETIAGLEAAEFSTLIEADVQVVADRTMTWGEGGYGSHAERGILTRTATKWYFAEGATFGNFNLFYLIQNPTNVAAQVTVTYLLPAPALPLVKSYVVSPRSRFNIWVDNEGLTDPAYAALANAELSAIIESTNGVPIIAERAMYLDQPGRPLGAGHESAGVTAPATQWFLAEGATGSYFDLFILIANPGNTAAAVQADYLLAGGQVITRTYSVAANSRFNIWVDLEDAALANAALSTRITSTNGVPIIVERSMWWPGPTSDTWQEAHNSPGETTTGTRWALAEGEVGGPRETETYVLVANTSPAAGTVRATVLFEDGTAPVVQDFGIGASTRINIAPFDDFPQTRGKRFGMIVESIGGAPVQILVERAMYSNAGGVRWAAGTNALATRLQ